MSREQSHWENWKEFLSVGGMIVLTYAVIGGFGALIILGLTKWLP